MSVIKSKAARLQNYLKSQHSRMVHEIEFEETFLSFLNAQVPVIKKLRDSFRGQQFSQQVSGDSGRGQAGAACRKADRPTFADPTQPSRLAALLKGSQLATPKTVDSKPSQVPRLRFDLAKRPETPAEALPVSDGQRFERRRFSNNTNSKISSFCSQLKQTPALRTPSSKPEEPRLGTFASSAGRLSFRASISHLAELRDGRAPHRSPKKATGSQMAAPKPTPASSRAGLNSGKHSSDDIRITNMLDRQPGRFFLNPELLLDACRAEIKEEAECSEKKPAPAEQHLGLCDSIAY